jgi:hypothetical protein
MQPHATGPPRGGGVTARDAEKATASSLAGPPSCQFGSKVTPCVKARRSRSVWRRGAGVDFSGHATL